MKTELSHRKATCINVYYVHVCLHARDVCINLSMRAVCYNVLAWVEDTASHSDGWGAAASRHGGSRHQGAKTACHILYHFTGCFLGYKLKLANLWKVRDHPNCGLTLHQTSQNRINSTIHNEGMSCYAKYYKSSQTLIFPDYQMSLSNNISY